MKQSISANIQPGKGEGQIHDMKVLVVDDHVLFREGLISLLKQEEGFQVVEQAGSVREALEITAARQPDVLVLDDLLPDGSGIEIIPALLHLSPETKIILLTIFEDKQSHLKALQFGAKECLTKTISSSQLVNSIKALGNS